MRRLLQAAALAALLALALASHLGLARVRPDLMLRLDPLLAAITWLADRRLPALLWPGLLVLASAPLLGRAFCGWLCPLGAAIDLLPPARRQRNPSAAPSLWILAAMAGAAVLGVSLAHLGSPLSLAERFAALVVAPLSAQGIVLVREALRPLLQDHPRLLLAEFKSALPQTAAWAALLAGGAVALGRLAPRYWCRGLCPAGALLGLCPPALGRRVTAACTRCGKCVRACPMAAIAAEPTSTDQTRCIQCRTCVKVCPENAVIFSLAIPLATPSPLRRHMLAALPAGLAAGALLRGVRPAQTQVVRPPGSVPEAQFLVRCVRCGACVAACPTGVLQPVVLAAGLEAAFSPALLPVRGACDPRGQACAGACPTLAIRPMPMEERPQARMGTAAVVRQRCLAWELGRKCLVCDEVCPYDAVILRPEPGKPVHVPHVDARRCAGCGFCEKHCPVQGPKAIVLEPKDAIRLLAGSVRQAALEKGLDLEIRPRQPAVEATDGGLPPGFSE